MYASMFSFSKKPNNNYSSNGSQLEDDNPKVLAENLYKRNIEILGKNKILSLLGKLYEISILTLNSQELAKRISKTIQGEFGFDVVGILLYNRQADDLTPLALTGSERILADSNWEPTFKNKTFPAASNVFLRKVIDTKTSASTTKLDEIWESLVSKKSFEVFKLRGRIKTSLVFPLLIQNEVIGILILSVNRQYNNLADYEKESINSLVNVIAVAMDKAILYEQLKINNEQLKILDKARAEFISIASHQLRTPPATIKWYLAAVLAGDYGRPVPKVRSALEKAQLTNNNLIGLIDDMLNASRIERGKMEFLFEYADVEKLTSDTIIQLRPQAVMRKLRLTYKKPKRKIVRILADKEKLQQVVNNLVDNAIKYTKKGGVDVALSQTSKDLILKVKDTGKGLAPGEKDAIFTKYGRGKDSQRQASGLGLGLYVAKVIVEHHKGKIWAESIGPNKGTTFVVSLPIKTDLKAETFDLTQNQLP